MPLVGGIVFWYFSKSLKCDESCQNDFGSLYRRVAASTSLVPLVLMFYIPTFNSFSVRFIMQQIVEEKQQKIRETLKLMSLTIYSYGLSYMCYQGIIAVIQGILIGAPQLGNKNLFPYNTHECGICFMLASILLFVSMVPFSMWFSTFTPDSKIANAMGSWLPILPVIILIAFLQIDNGFKYLIYIFYLIPMFPGCILLLLQIKKGYAPMNAKLMTFPASVSKGFPMPIR